MRFFSAVDIFIIIMITALSDAGTALNQLAWLKGVRSPPRAPPPLCSIYPPDRGEEMKHSSALC